MKKVFAPFVGGPGAVGLLLLRIAMGVAFVIHGSGKVGWPNVSIGHAMSWMGPKSDIPGFFQGLAALAEFGGGLALIFGFVTPLAALGIMATMAVAYFKVMVPNHIPFVADKPGAMSYELVAVFFTAATLFLTVGPGKLSLDYLIFGNGKKRK